MTAGAPDAAGARTPAAGTAKWLAFGVSQLAMLAVMTFAMTTGPSPLAQLGAALLLVVLAGVDAVRGRRGRHDPLMALDGLAMAGLVAVPFLLPANGHHGAASGADPVPAMLAVAIAVGWWLARAAPLLRAPRREPIDVAGVAVAGAMVGVMAVMHLLGAHP
ncbi:hypothetical protein ROT00_15740 [Agromyces mediolanus]|uniref:hypothetical protein n=1 Tax=Agromyces mediolanus TaxID=41986 RepID=UPI00383694D4